MNPTGMAPELDPLPTFHYETLQISDGDTVLQGMCRPRQPIGSDRRLREAVPLVSDGG